MTTTTLPLHVVQHGAGREQRPQPAPQATPVPGSPREGRPGVGPALTCRATEAAVRALGALCTEAGPVVLVYNPALSNEVLCLGLADYVTGPQDVELGRVQGCAVYVDRRAWWMFQDATVVLDVVPRAKDGPRFRLRLPTTPLSRPFHLVREP